MPLVFETATPLTTASPNRSDVACFIGFIARRDGVPLSDSVRDALRVAGWAKSRIGLPSSPWARNDDAVESLADLPVTVESWEAFAKLFAWEKRPLRADVTGEENKVSIAYCTTYLGAAVRSFFVRGGKRAVIVRVGDPWPYLETAEEHTARQLDRLQSLLPDLPAAVGKARPFEPTNPGNWQGIEHLYGLREVSILSMPDLPDICAAQPPIPATVLPPPTPPEGFVECSENEPEMQSDSGLRMIPAPRFDNDSFAPWQSSVNRARGFLARYQRQVIFIAALPLPHAEARSMIDGGWAHAETDIFGFLRAAGVIEPPGQFKAGESAVASAFVQFAHPWLRTRASADLPESVEPADGVLAGLLAANAIERGTFRSAAGQFSVPRLNDVHDSVPLVSWDVCAGSPVEQLTERVCVFAPTPDGMTLLSDVTCSADPAWRFGGATRLMGAVLRAARRVGESVLFEANGPVLWSQIRRGMEDLLTAFWHEGALAGASAEEAFSVRCDRSTMTQTDIDNGRLLVEISLRPAASIVWITVVLDLAANGSGADSLREVA